jgi:hypothetical protein
MLNLDRFGGGIRKVMSKKFISNWWVGIIAAMFAGSYLRVDQRVSNWIDSLRGRY